MIAGLGEVPCGGLTANPANPATSPSRSTPLGLSGAASAWFWAEAEARKVTAPSTATQTTKPISVPCRCNRPWAWAWRRAQRRTGGYSLCSRRPSRTWRGARRRTGGYSLRSTRPSGRALHRAEGTAVSVTAFEGTTLERSSFVNPSALSDGGRTSAHAVANGGLRRVTRCPGPIVSTHRGLGRVTNTDGGFRPDV